MASQHKESVISGILFGVIAAFIWGIFPVVTRMSVEQSLSVYDIAALRFMVAGPLLIPVLWRYKLHNISILGVTLLVCGAGAPYLMLAIGGLVFAPASHFGAITPSCMLVIAAIGSCIWLKERFSRARLLGSAVIISGIVVISWEGLSHNDGNMWIGDLMFILGGAFWAAYTVAIRYWKIAPLHAIAIVSVFSMIVYLPPYFIFAESKILQAPIGEVLFQGLFQGVLSVLVALLLYSKAVTILGAARGAIFGALVPSFALLLAYPVLDEFPTTLQWIGVALVTGGMLLALGILQKRVPTE